MTVLLTLVAVLVLASYVAYKATKPEPIVTNFGIKEDFVEEVKLEEVKQTKAPKLTQPKVDEAPKTVKTTAKPKLEATKTKSVQESKELKKQVQKKK
jgi:hypothetical protein